MIKKISHTASLLALCSLTGIAKADDAYRCKSEDGKTTIQSWPCSGETPKEKPKTPNYPQIVECGMLDGIDKMAKQLVGIKAQPKDCTTPKK